MDQNFFNEAADAENIPSSINLKIIYGVNQNSE